MRLFIAIDLPDWTKRQLEELQDPNLGVRWTSSETMHLTLRFIGDVEEVSVRENLVKQLSSVQGTVFNMTINKLGYFPPRKHPKILWAGIHKNNKLMQLQENIEQVCRSVGFEPEKRSYIPHITIGRTKNISKKEVHSFLNEHKKLRIEQISVNEFILYESKLHPDGAEHIPFEHFGLAGESTEEEA